MLYPLLRVVSGRALAWFYSRVDVEGVDRIPRDAPVLLAVNHPNALVDALVVGHVVPRRLGFTARATLFTNPVLAAFLRVAGVVPLIRQKDVAELGTASDADRNARAFAAINAALASGRAILIFPEGVTGDWTELAPLKTGAARIALQARDAGVRDLAIVPIGLTFERKDAPRTRVFAQVGEPIAVDTWKHSVHDLTAELEKRLRAVTLNFDSQSDADRDRALAAQLARLFRGTQATPQVWQRYAPLTDQVAIAHRIDEARERMERAPAPLRERADELLARLATFRDTLARHGIVIEDLEIDLGARKGTWFVVREMAVAVIAAPLAAWGWVNHVIPFRLARLIAMRQVESAADPAMNTIVVGLILVLAFYAAQAALVAALFGWLAALLYMVSLPVAADVNFHLQARLRRVVQRARAYLRLRSDPGLRVQLVEQLRTLRADALAVEDSLRHQPRPL